MAVPELPAVPPGQIQRVGRWESDVSTSYVALPFRLQVGDILWVAGVVLATANATVIFQNIDVEYYDGGYVADSGTNSRSRTGNPPRLIRVYRLTPGWDPNVRVTEGTSRLLIAVYRGVATWDHLPDFDYSDESAIKWQGTPLKFTGTNPATAYPAAPDTLTVEYANCYIVPSRTNGSSWNFSAPITYTAGPITTATPGTTVGYLQGTLPEHGDGILDGIRHTINLHERRSASPVPAATYYANPSSWTSGDHTYPYNWGLGSEIGRAVLQTSIKATVVRPALAALKSYRYPRPLKVPLKIPIKAVVSHRAIPGLKVVGSFRPVLSPLVTYGNPQRLITPARPPLRAIGAHAVISPLVLTKVPATRPLNAIRRYAYIPSITTVPIIMPTQAPMNLDDSWHYYTTMAPVLPVVDTTIGLAGAVTGATPGTVMDSQPGQIHSRLQATLRIRPDVAVVERVIEGAMKRQWQDELNETGSASMEIPNEHPDATTINEGNVVVFADEGWTVFGWIIKEIERIQIARGEDIDQVTSFSGVGLLAVLEEAVVYPPRGVGRKPYTDDRYFSWFSPDFEAQWFWPQATMYGKWRDMNTPDHDWANSKGEPMPEDWPDPDAQWIWCAGVTLDSAPVGDCYFAGEFTVPPGVDQIEVFVAADNYATIYFDGQEMGSSQWDGVDTVAWEQTIEVTPGEHYLAVKVENITHAQARIDSGIDEVVRAPGISEANNPAGLLCTVFQTDGMDLLGKPLYASHDGWRVLAYPSTPPGMTPGMAMWHCIYEALLRGTMDGLKIAFNDEVDSNGQPWPVLADISTKIGTDYLTFFRELCATYVDMWMEPASFTLHAWIKGTRGDPKPDIELFGVTDTTDPWSGNLAGLTYRIAE